MQVVLSCPITWRPCSDLSQWWFRITHSLVKSDFILSVSSWVVSLPKRWSQPLLLPPSNYLLNAIMTTECVQSPLLSTPLVYWRRSTLTWMNPSCFCVPYVMSTFQSFWKMIYLFSRTSFPIFSQELKNHIKSTATFSKLLISLAHKKYYKTYPTSTWRSSSSTTLFWCVTVSCSSAQQVEARPNATKCSRLLSPI